MSLPAQMSLEVEDRKPALRCSVFEIATGNSNEPPVPGIASNILNYFKLSRETLDIHTGGSTLFLLRLYRESFTRELTTFTRISLRRTDSLARPNHA